MIRETAPEACQSQKGDFTSLVTNKAITVMKSRLRDMDSDFATFPEN